MTTLDWLLVLLINGSIIVYGLYLAWGTHSSSEWFLASRALPWWAVGLSMFATNVDSADLAGVTSMTFKEGLHVISVYALGSAVGGILAAYFIVPEICRRGFYTNAEYLEARYGPSTRVLSALIQIQYRTSTLGVMIWSTHLVLTEFIKLTPYQAWGLIILLVLLAGLYTAWGGLKSVVWTDTAQGIVMIVAACVIFGAVWNAVGGWYGLEDKLATVQEETGRPETNLLHIGKYRGDSGTISPLLIVLGWTIIGSGYWTVNHTQTMRLMGSRSIWDMKLAALFGVGISLPVTVISACLGVMAHGIDSLPPIDDADKVYPILAYEFLGPGLKGLVIAGLFAAIVSTFDSMGSALSAIFTRDVYARLIASNRSDRHYVLVGRIATAGVLLIGFAYVPFIAKQDHMLKAFTTLIPVFVTPLFTIYLAGIFTRVHRRSGIVGLLVGGTYGVIALLDRQAVEIAELLHIQALPGWYTDSLAPWFTERWVALSWSIGFTLVPMVLTTLILGKENLQADEQWQERGWLQRSREELPAFHDQHKPSGWGLNFAAIALLLLAAWVTFVLFW